MVFFAYSLSGKNSMLLDISTLTWNRNFIPNIERPARVTACQTPEGMGKRSFLFRG